MQVAGKSSKCPHIMLVADGAEALRERNRSSSASPKIGQRSPQFRLAEVQGRPIAAEHHRANEARNRRAVALDDMQIFFAATPPRTFCKLPPRRRFPSSWLRAATPTPTPAESLFHRLRAKQHESGPRQTTVDFLCPPQPAWTRPQTFSWRPLTADIVARKPPSPRQTHPRHRRPPLSTATHPGSPSTLPAWLRFRANAEHSSPPSVRSAAPVQLFPSVPFPPEFQVFPVLPFAHSPIPVGRSS